MCTSETSVRQLSRDTELRVEEMDLEFGLRSGQRDIEVIRIYMVLRKSPQGQMPREKG